MTKVQKVSRNTKYPTGSVLIWGGLILIIVWPVVLGVTNLLQNLPCMISPASCSAGTSVARGILFAPIAIGSLMLPVGILYSSKMSREVKFFISLLLALGLFFIAYWIIALVSIAIYGFGA